MVEIKNEFGRLSEIELSDFENINGIKLPIDYRRFLLEFNGGRPIYKQNTNPDTIVDYILGMHNGIYSSSLYKNIDLFKGRLPLSTFPIARDPFGNLFIMSLHNENYGHIYFWDHEGEPEHQDGHYVDNCTYVASSFSEFFEGLN